MVSPDVPMVPTAGVFPTLLGPQRTADRGPKRAHPWLCAPIKQHACWELARRRSKWLWSLRLKGVVMPVLHDTRPPKTPPVRDGPISGGAKRAGRFGRHFLETCAVM